MAFPSIATTSSSNDAAGSSTFTLTLPTGISSGDKLILWVAVDGNTTVSWPAGYTELFNRNFSAGGFAGSGTGSLAYRNCDGTEGSSITVTKGNTQEDAWGCYRITGASSTAPEFQFAEGNSDSPDCPSLTPSWGAKDTLWIVAACQDNADLTGTAPTNYANNVLHQFNTDAEIVMGSRQLNAASEDPGTFAAAADEWFALTIAVEPGTGDQTITGALYTDADTFHAATVTPGAVGITGALYSDSDTFHASTVNATYTVSGAIYTDGDSFQAATVTVGSVDIAGALYTDADTFFGATVSQDGSPQEITGALFSDADTFNVSIVSTFYDISGALVVDADTFFGSTVGATYGITGALYTDSDTFYAATVGSAVHQIEGALVTDGDTFHSATVNSTYAITGALFSDSDTLWTATVNSAYSVVGSLYSDGDTFHAASLFFSQNITASLFVDDDTFPSSSFAQDQVVNVSGLQITISAGTVTPFFWDRVARDEVTWTVVSDPSSATWTTVSLPTNTWTPLDTES